MITATATMIDETAEFNAEFERIRIATGPHLPAWLPSPFQRWALKFVAAHGADAELLRGTIALADGRVRVASAASIRDASGYVADCTCLNYAADIAEVYEILGY